MVPEGDGYGRLWTVMDGYGRSWTVVEWESYINGVRE
jgi:hypothetical protein